MRLKVLLLLCLCAAGFAVALALGGAHADGVASPQRASACSSGYVDAIIGGEHKCLHAGEFCAVQYEADYERYGFSCLNGRLQTFAAPAPPTTAPTEPTATVPSTSTTTTSTVADTYQPLPRTKTLRCRAHGGLPDSACTPGAVFVDVTAATVCTPGFSASVRNVPASEKRAVYAEYGTRKHRRGQYEADHLISLELGGSNAIANLWPEAARPRPGFHEKDSLENFLHAEVCGGSMTLADAQRAIATDWLTAYKIVHP